MNVSTMNRLAAPLTAAALAATTVVAPFAITGRTPDLPTIAVSAVDLDLLAAEVFDPSVPLINWGDIGASPLTPIPQILLMGLANPALMIPTFAALAPYLSSIPALPLAGMIAGPDHLLTALANDFPILEGIASGYNSFAQDAAGFLTDIPLVGQPIETAFAMLPMMSQWLLASVVNPFPAFFDTSDFWSGIGGFLTGGDDAGVGSAAAGLFDFDLGSLFGGFDFGLGGVLDGISGFFDDLIGGFDLGGLFDFDLSGLLGVDFDLGLSDLAAMALAPLDAVGLSLMLGPLTMLAIPMAITAWAGSTVLGML